MNLDLCQYRDLFGKPYEGIRQSRFPIINIAVADTIAVLIVAYLITYWLYGNDLMKFICVLIALILIGILAHKLFCVNTALNVALFGNNT